MGVRRPACAQEFVHSLVASDDRAQQDKPPRSVEAPDTSQEAISTWMSNRTAQRMQRAWSGLLGRLVLMPRLFKAGSQVRVVQSGQIRPEINGGHVFAPSSVRNSASRLLMACASFSARPAFLFVPGTSNQSGPNSNTISSSASTIRKASAKQRR